MNKQDVQNWLDQYGEAWVKGAPDQIVTLFTQTASYRETPFDEAMKGSDAIRQYWQEGASDAQENVQFASQVWAVDGETAVAGWQASFTRVPSGAQVTLDGTFHLTLVQHSAGLLCDRLLEWWHRNEA